MNYYLKTEDEQSLWLALEACSLAERDYDLEDELNVRPNSNELNQEWQPSGAYDWRFTGESLDIIGAIYTSTDNMLTGEDGIEYPEMAPIDGFHANLKAQDGVEGLPTVEVPATPYRKWAGE
jgi:hypothetical protein